MPIFTTSLCFERTVIVGRGKNLRAVELRLEIGAGEKEEIIMLLR